MSSHQINEKEQNSREKKLREIWAIILSQFSLMINRMVDFADSELASRNENYSRTEKNSSKAAECQTSGFEKVEKKNREDRDNQRKKNSDFAGEDSVRNFRNSAENEENHSENFEFQLADSIRRILPLILQEFCP